MTSYIQLTELEKNSLLERCIKRPGSLSALNKELREDTEFIHALLKRSVEPKIIAFLPAKKVVDVIKQMSAKRLNHFFKLNPEMLRYFPTEEIERLLSGRIAQGALEQHRASKKALLNTSVAQTNQSKSNDVRRGSIQFIMLLYERNTLTKKEAAHAIEQLCAQASSKEALQEELRKNPNAIPLLTEARIIALISADGPITPEVALKHDEIFFMGIPDNRLQLIKDIYGDPTLKDGIRYAKPRDILFLLRDKTISPSDAVSAFPDYTEILAEACQQEPSLFLIYAPRFKDWFFLEQTLLTLCQQSPQFFLEIKRDLLGEHNEAQVAKLLLHVLSNREMRGGASFSERVREKSAVAQIYGALSKEQLFWILQHEVLSLGGSKPGESDVDFLLNETFDRQGISEVLMMHELTARICWSNPQCTKTPEQYARWVSSAEDYQQLAPEDRALYLQSLSPNDVLPPWLFTTALIYHDVLQKEFVDALQHLWLILSKHNASKEIAFLDKLIRVNQDVLPGMINNAQSNHIWRHIQKISSQKIQHHLQEKLSVYLEMPKIPEQFTSKNFEYGVKKDALIKDKIREIMWADKTGAFEAKAEKINELFKIVCRRRGLLSGGFFEKSDLLKYSVSTNSAMHLLRQVQQDKENDSDNSLYLLLGIKGSTDEEIKANLQEKMSAAIADTLSETPDFSVIKRSP